jgi:hypothetical protein
MELNPQNFSETVDSLVKMVNGKRSVRGGPGVGKTTRFTVALAKSMPNKKVVVIEPTACLASNAAYSINNILKEEFAGAFTSVAPYTSNIGNLMFVNGETFLRRYSEREFLSDRVGMVILDEEHVSSGDYEAVKSILLQVMKDIPVIGMTGTVSGMRTAHGFEGVIGRSISDYVPSDTKKTLIFCESDAEALSMGSGEGKICLTKFASYASVTKVMDILSKPGGIKVYIGPSSSEGLNLPVEEVVDCRSKLVFSIDRNKPVLEIEAVSSVEHVQRAARLRNGGVYYGEPIATLKDLELVSLPDKFANALKFWWLKQLDIMDFEAKKPDDTGEFLINNVKRIDVNRNLGEGRDWWDDRRPNSPPPGYGSDGENSNGSDESDTVVTLPVRNDLISGLGFDPLERMPSKDLECRVWRGTIIPPDSRYVDYFDKIAAGNHKVHMGHVNLKALASLIECRNKYLYMLRRNKFDKRAIAALNCLKLVYEENMLRIVEDSYLGDDPVFFAYGSKSDRKVYAGDKFFCAKKEIYGGLDIDPQKDFWSSFSSVGT